HAISLELRRTDALKRRDAPRVREVGGLPYIAVDRAQGRAADCSTISPELAGSAEHHVKDQAVDGFGALHNRKSLHVPIPVLARTGAIRRPRAVRERDLTDFAPDPW